MNALTGQKTVFCKLAPGAPPRRRGRVVAIDPRGQQGGFVHYATRARSPGRSSASTRNTTCYPRTASAFTASRAGSTPISTPSSKAHNSRCRWRSASAPASPGSSSRCGCGATCSWTGAWPTTSPWISPPTPGLAAASGCCCGVTLEGAAGCGGPEPRARRRDLKARALSLKPHTPKAKSAAVQNADVFPRPPKWPFGLHTSRGVLA